MARNEAGSVINRISEDIRSGKLEHLYVLFGEEAYLKDQFKRQLTEALMPENPSMNFSAFSGKGVDPGEICSLAQTLPFLADHRLILLEDTQFFKKANDAMVELIKAIPKEVYIVFSEDAVDKRSRMYKATLTAGLAAEMTTPDDGTLRKWLVQSAKRGGHPMEPAAAQTMIEWCGRDMFLLHHEMEKLISYVEPEQPITAEDVRAIGTRQLKDTIFQLTSAMAVRSGSDAFAAYRELLRLETKPGQILYMLRREFKLIWLTKALREQGESDREIGRIAKIHPAFVGRYIKAQTAFTEEQLRQITEELADIQARIHTGRAKDREALEIFMTEHTGE